MGHRWSRCAAGIALMLRANDGSVRTARQLRRILANACVRGIQGAAAEIGSKASR